MSRLLRLRRIFCCTLAVLALSDLSSAAVAPSEIEAATWSRRAFGALTPEISPDGEHLAFSYQGAIWRMPRSGGVMRRLTSGPGFDDNPSWSPDGRQLAYVCSTTGEVRVIDAESGRLLQAVPQVLATGKVFFARDGKHLLLGFRSPARWKSPPAESSRSRIQQVRSAATR
jgi:tricorn protease